MKTLLFVFFALGFLTAGAQSDPCLVSLDSLKGSYEGGCEKGKANGEGKAIGVHSYTGSFKNGLPDGQGKYTWPNGDFYFGGWKKGLKEGKGELHLPVNGIDSVITGFWKKDMYKGQYENPYQIMNNSTDIGRVAVSKIRGNTMNITVTVENLVGGGSIYNQSLGANTRMTDHRVTRGIYQSKSSNLLTNKEVTTFQNVSFPFRIWMYFGNSNVEIEFFEEGSYDVNIPINK
ncbi:MAG: hypothetical protein IPI66_02005 [Chitinophagaceae bacterium]|nr:hypothetical protein [Chitinophagaceae bacterium]